MTDSRSPARKGPATARFRISQRILKCTQKLGPDVLGRLECLQNPRPMSTVLLHLSDLHLREEEVKSTQDLDEDIRAKVLEDLATAALPIGNSVDGVLITGDIAFGGRETEYDAAYAWLQTLCRSIGCDEARVWLVPGNHDVHRPTIEKSALIQGMHLQIREHERPASELRRYLRDAEAARTLLSPFEHFNKFAKRFNSTTESGAVAWQSEDDEFVLNDGSILRLRGINSALVSDQKDDDGPPAQVLGERQVQLNNEPGVTCVVLCHHPPDWLLDQDKVTDYFRSRATIQLYGHKHRQRVSNEQHTIRLHAGALHPPRDGETWQPHYNLIVLRVDRTGAQRRLHTEIFQRAWHEEEVCFGPNVNADGGYPKTYDLELGPWDPPMNVEPRNHPSAEQEGTASEGQMSKERPISAPRDIVYRFFSIPYPRRTQLILNLGLLEEEDEGIEDSELIRRVVKRARETDLLEELRKSIDVEVETRE